MNYIELKALIQKDTIRNAGKFEEEKFAVNAQTMRVIELIMLNPTIFDSACKASQQKISAGMKDWSLAQTLSLANQSGQHISSLSQSQLDKINWHAAFFYLSEGLIA